MKILIPLLFILSASANAFTLLMPSPPRFADDIIIRASDADCANAGLSAADLRDLIQRAIDDYWNSVPTSRAKFNLGASVTVPPGSDLDDMVALASDGEIIVGCSDDATTFPNASTLAKGGLSGASPRGVVAINDIVGTRFADSDELTKVSTFAHELGHAIGIGHSRIQHALMYYAVVGGVVNEHLTEDDADAITYLYPKDKELLGLGGACGTVDLGGNNGNGPGPFILTLLCTFLITVVVPKLKRPLLP